MSTQLFLLRPPTYLFCVVILRYLNIIRRAMTKLLEWVSVVSALFAVWYSLVGGYVKHPLIEQYSNIILVSPIIFVILFGLYAVTVVLYRVFTFNDCEEAAKELQEAIKEAREDLTQKGLKW